MITFKQFMQLLEDRIPALKQRYGVSLDSAISRDTTVPTGFGSDDLLQHIDKHINPTGSNNKYADYVINQYKNGNIKHSDLGEVSSSIEWFHKNKNRLLDKDIKSYSMDDLHNMREQIPDIKPPVNRLVYQSHNLRVMSPETKEAAIKYYGGGKTNWCTASTGPQNKFDEYNRYSPLYFFHTPEGMYQYNKSRNEFGFQGNTRASLDDFLKKYPEVKGIPELKGIDIFNSDIEERIRNGIINHRERKELFSRPELKEVGDEGHMVKLKSGKYNSDDAGYIFHNISGGKELLQQALTKMLKNNTVYWDQLWHAKMFDYFTDEHKILINRKASAMAKLKDPDQALMYQFLNSGVLHSKVAHEVETSLSSMK